MWQSWIVLGALVKCGCAFPAMADALVEGVATEASTRTIDARQQKGGFPEPKPSFNAVQQLVSVEGKHKFVPPDFAAGDVRGPCPGLNAMANHGYLPHSGVGTHLDFIQGTYDVFGMGADLAGFLTVLGATLDGDGLSWSIGGPSKYLPGLPPLLGTPQGISGSHNRYESDVSPGRGDLYKYGDDYTLQMSQFQELYDMGQKAGDEYSLETLQAFRSKRFDNSIKTNPYFFNGPFTGVLVQPAAYTFIYRFMGNKSEHYPRGRLNGDVLLSFFGVTKQKDGSLKKVPGHERIPYNWYKRAIGNEYGIPYLNLDTTYAATKYPKYLDVGGNLGKPNTFTGVSIQNLTGGALSSKDLLKGNNLACFAMEFAVQSAPDLLRCSSVIGNIEKAMNHLTAQQALSSKKLGCPKLGNPNTDQFKQFPGYSKLNCKTGTYST